MTYGQFLKELQEVAKVKPFSVKNGSLIRTVCSDGGAHGACPIAAVYFKQEEVIPVNASAEPAVLAEKMGLDYLTAMEIVSAADGYRSPVRMDLLTACRLPNGEVSL